ncbi:hypothetical protein [Altererythrobacter sp. GH1-8]|uniref:hypothetical protein n=1 Tax=Altererythrobacter sp. GH1-8 TaxID=3349333 RepID=UPI00374CCFCC
MTANRSANAAPLAMFVMHKLFRCNVALLQAPALSVLSLDAVVPAGHMLEPFTGHFLTLVLCSSTNPLVRAFAAEADCADGMAATQMDHAAMAHGAIDHAAMGHLPFPVYDVDSDAPGASQTKVDCALSSLAFAATLRVQPGDEHSALLATGGPSATDPPLHYAPSILVERIEIACGVAPVSQGPSLAGAVNARLAEVQFNDSSGLPAQGPLAIQYRSVDDSYALGGMVGLANDRWRLGVIASREEGDDYQFAGGTVVGTSFERNLYGTHAAFRKGTGELLVEYRCSETDPSGNPPFALDIVYFNTDFIQGGFKGEIAQDVAVDLRLGHVAVRHLVDNQTTRRLFCRSLLDKTSICSDRV